MDFIVEITPRVIGSQTSSKIIQVSTTTRDSLSGSNDHYNWMYKWADYLAHLLLAMEDSMEFFSQKLSGLIQTIQFLVNDGVRESDFGQYKLQEVITYSSYFIVNIIMIRSRVTVMITGVRVLTSNDC
jgi:hypothetical protein